MHSSMRSEKKAVTDVTIQFLQVLLISQYVFKFNISFCVAIDQILLCSNFPEGTEMLTHACAPLFAELLQAITEV